MGKKDENQSLFYESKERFADLFNGCIFQGNNVINPQELAESDSVMVLNLPKAKDRASKIIADKIYSWKGISTSVMILESQSYVDYGMVLRVMKDEIAAYDKQRRKGLEEWKKENCDTSNTISNKNSSTPKKSSSEFISSMHPKQKLIPVLTLVLYIGTDTPWDGRAQLYDLMDIEDALKPYINNYKINIYDFHQHNDFSIFKTENRLLFELLSVANDKNKMIQMMENNENFHHADPEVIKMIIGSTGMNIDLKKIQKNEKGEYDMCKAIEEWKKDLIIEGYNRGEQDGYNKGREIELKNNVNTLMNNMKLSLKETLDLLNVPVEDRTLFYTTH